jgi:hypothetical protein
MVPGEEPAKPKPTDQQAEIAQALGEVARIRFGKFLNNEQMKAVQRRLENSVRSGGLLGKFKLKNSDEPAFLFRADGP